MLKMKSVVGPTLDTFGQFEIDFGECAYIETENFDRLITGTASSGGTTIPQTDTSGYAVGQVISIQDSAGHETATISAITAGTSLTVSANLTNSYTVARGATVTVVKFAASRVSVDMGSLFTSNTTFAKNAVARNLVRIYGTVSAAFTQGETATGTGGATGTVVAQGSDYIDVLPLTGTYLTSDTVTGGSSGSTVTSITSIDTNGPATVLVTVEKATISGTGPNAYSAAATADVAGVLFTATVDAHA